MEEQFMETLKHQAKDMLEQGNAWDAMPLLRQAAHWGDLESQRLCADIYLEGMYGVTANPWAAFEYVRMAALNEDALAMRQLAHMFETGKGADRDLEKAFYFYKKAAGLEEPSAYDPLAMLYLKGQGTAKDLEKALFYAEKAAKAFPEEENIQKHLHTARLALAKYQQS